MQFYATNKEIERFLGIREEKEENVWHYTHIFVILHII